MSYLTIAANSLDVVGAYLMRMAHLEKDEGGRMKDENVPIG
jgi:hypothetical protein